MSNLILILGDQLNENMSSLKGVEKGKDKILMAEVRSEATYVKHHKKKIVFLFSAMRHFAKHLQELGYDVEYVKYDAPNNKGSLFNQVRELLKSEVFKAVKVAHPGEYRLYQEIKSWQEQLGVDVNITPDNRFMSDQYFFSKWAKGRKQLRMEYFYREMRKNTGILMDNGKPTQGKWNFDSENRKKLPKNHSLPSPTVFKPNDMTKEVLNFVQKEFAEHFGDLDDFHYAVTREQALIVLEEFISVRLPLFGTYQDAMAQNEAWMYHSHISFYLNCGLLMPDEVVNRVEQAFNEGNIPINSAEGFIRQVVGWREYIKGFYWHFMPNLKKQNHLQARRAVPEFFWTSETNMNCLNQCISQTKKNAYAHHIQRLMVLGNFALLAGLNPDEVNEWYMIVYADAYEWVELPNVSSMVLFADGGLLASKPYASSGAYIHKMSNYCNHCSYKVTEKTGDQACPFNYLYWNFLLTHQEKFMNNPRMAMIYRTLFKMDESKVASIVHDSNTFLIKLENNEKV